MKLIFFIFCIWAPLQAQIVNIPDVNFKNKLLAHNPIIDTNSNGEIEVAEAEAVLFPLNVAATVPAIVDITGIEAFINIEAFNCAGNLIENLDLSANTLLLTLDCSNNAITTINLSQNVFLKNFTGSQNPYTSLDLSNNADLEFFQSNAGSLTTLTLGNKPHLQFLYAYGNALTQLDISNCPILEGLTVDENNLSHIDLSNNNQLRYFYGRSNLFTSLDVSNNPTIIALDLKWNDALTYINLKNGNNGNLNISGTGQTCNFEELPLLETVCLDDVNSSLASFIEAQAGHSVVFTENCPLSIEDVVQVKATFHPNPVKDMITIEATGKILEIQLYNLLGELVMNSKTNNYSIEIDISDFSKGLYILTIKDEFNNVQSVKILKE
ncbi:MAG: T9SS type A sorting domain-containing protein [Flavobacteriaceae bacterium]